MADNHKISEFIDGISFKKTIGGGFRPDEVYDSICQLTSLYNEVLADSYKENDELKKMLEEHKGATAPYAQPQSFTDKEKPTSMTGNSQPLTQSEIDFRKEFAKELDEYYSMKAQYEFAAMQEQNPLPSFDEPDDEPMHETNIAENEDIPSAHKTEYEERAMTEKDLQKMKRTELLEMLIDLSRENEMLRSKLASLDEEISILNEKLNDKKLKIEKAGTMAEASFLVNGVVEATEAAAAQYLENLRELSEREELNCKKKEAEAEETVARMLNDAKAQCESMLRTVEDRCSAMTFVAQQQCDAMKQESVKFCETLEAETVKKCDELEEFTKSKCESREKQSSERCASLDRRAREDSAKCWDDVSKKVDSFYKLQDYLNTFLEDVKKSRSDKE